MISSPTPRIPSGADSTEGVVSLDEYDGYDRVRDSLAPVKLTQHVRALDPITHDLVRLRNAELQGCHYCRSFRSAPAQREGLTESMVEAVHDYEHSTLSERHKVALRLTDAFIFNFGKVSPELARAARAHFSDAEILDIALKIFHSTRNKVRIALAFDDPADIEQVIGVRTMEYPVAPEYARSAVPAS